MSDLVKHTKKRKHTPSYHDQLQGPPRDCYVAWAHEQRDRRRRNKQATARQLNVSNTPGCENHQNQTMLAVQTGTVFRAYPQQTASTKDAAFPETEEEHDFPTFNIPRRRGGHLKPHHEHCLANYVYVHIVHSLTLKNTVWFWSRTNNSIVIVLGKKFIHSFFGRIVGLKKTL